MDWLRKRNKAKRLKKWLEKVTEDFDKMDKAKARIRKEALQSCDGFIRALELKGFEQLGGGAFSTVMAHPSSNKVIKICRRPEEDGWVDYIRWASEKGFAGTFAPKVYSYKYIKHDDNPDWRGVRRGFGVAVMERMDKTLRDCDRKADANVIDALFVKVAQYDNPLAKKLLDSIQPNFGLFSAEVHAKFKDNLDLHGGNVMVRKDGSFCVTDPVAGLNSEKFKERWSYS